eukprot:GHVT01093586.1.p1 GENE.GHVT01093586.1~~GHVT01093586.1.p1  ORF type:complete len:106 (-),score=1.16 GHVT01093586.1:130-447(-)
MFIVRRNSGNHVHMDLRTLGPGKSGFLGGKMIAIGDASRQLTNASASTTDCRCAGNSPGSKGEGKPVRQNPESGFQLFAPLCDDYQQSALGKRRQRLSRTPRLRY